MFRFRLFSRPTPVNLPATSATITESGLMRRSPLRRPYWRRWALGAFALSFFGHGLTLLWSQGHLSNWWAQAAPTVERVQMVSLQQVATPPVLATPRTPPAPAKPRPSPSASERPAIAPTETPTSAALDSASGAAATPAAPALPSDLPTAPVSDAVIPPPRFTYPPPTLGVYDLDARIKTGIGRIPLSSTAHLTWQANQEQFSLTLEEQQYGFRFRTRGLLTPNGLQYTRWEDLVGSRKNTRAVTYDYARQQMLFSAGNKTLPIPDNVQNLVGLLIQMGIYMQTNPDLLVPNRAVPLPVTVAKDLLNLTVQYKGIEAVDTSLGSISAHVFTTLSGQAGPEEGAVIWVSPVHQYWPIKFQLVSDNGSVLTATLKALIPIDPLPPSYSVQASPDGLEAPWPPKIEVPSTQPTNSGG